MIVTDGVVIVSVEPLQVFHGSFVVEDGLIVELLPDRVFERSADKGILDARGCVVLPGLTNGHVHSGVALFRGLVEDKSLLDLNVHEALLDATGRLQNDREAQLLCSEYTYLECVRRGTTFVCDVPLTSLGRGVIDIFQRVGLRGAVIENTEYGPEYLSQQCEALASAGIIPQLWLHSEAKTETVSNFTEAHLRQISQLAAELGVGMHMHFAETDWRVASVRARFQGRTTTRILADHGLLGRGFVGAHGVHVDQADIELLACNNAAVVACPSAEMKLADGIAPVPGLLRAGVAVALGTDGALYNNANDLFAEMKTLTLLHKLASGVTAISASEALQMATAGGARAFGLEREAGTLREGKRADFVLLNAADPAMYPVWPDAPRSVASQVVYSGSGHLVDTVVVGGDVVVQAGRHTGINEQVLALRVREAAMDFSFGLRHE